MKAYTYEMGGNGKGKEGPIPANMADAAKEAHEKLVELVAEGKDELMEEFFETGTIPEEHLVPAAPRSDSRGQALPRPVHLRPRQHRRRRAHGFHRRLHARRQRASRHHRLDRRGQPSLPTAKAPTPNPRPSMFSKPSLTRSPAAFHTSRFFPACSKTTPRCRTYNRNTLEKFAHISLIQGKTAVPINEIHAGDIGAVAKLRETLTGDTLGDKASPIRYPAVKLPEPAITFAIEPKSRADEDKLGVGLHKLMEEDAMLRFFRDPQTKEFLIAGTGQQHIEVVVSKMKQALPRGSSPESAQGSVSRNHSRQSRRPGTPQEADRRPRPIRRLQNQDGAAAARR